MSWKTDLNNPEYGSERQRGGKYEIRLKKKKEIRLGGWPKGAVNTNAKGNTIENGKEKTKFQSRNVEWY